MKPKIKPREEKGGVEMNRYGFTSDDMCHAGCRIVRFSDGAYVKYEDIEALLKLGFGRVHCGACGADMSKGNHLKDCYIISTAITIPKKTRRS